MAHTIMRTTELLATTTLDELDEIFIEGPDITIPGSPVQGVQLTVVDPATGQEYTITEKNTVTAPQMGTIRGEYFRLGYSRQTDLATAHAACRAEYKLTDRQQDSILVDKIRARQSAQNRNLDPTDRQDDLSLRIMDALINGRSLGNGQSHLDRKIATLGSVQKDMLVRKFGNAENQGQFQKALDMFGVMVGKFDRTVGQRAETRNAERAVTTPVTPEQYAAWSSGASVVAPVTAPASTDEANTDQTAPVDPALVTAGAPAPAQAGKAKAGKDEKEPF